MERSSLLDTAYLGNLLDASVYHIVATNIEKVVAYSVWFVSFDNLHRNIHQLDLERYSCLLSLRHYPR